MSIPLWTGEEIAAATGGTLVGDFGATSVSIDTRTLEAGDLFVPIRATRDGHDFLDAAFRAGAAGALSEVDTPHPHARVDDTLIALRRLAEAARTRSRAVRIGITGSVGKTSLRAAVATICAAAGPTHSSIKSFNNHLGVPLTLARMPRQAAFGVFEMGMNHAGELTKLSAIVRPDVAVVTKIAPAHLENFENLDAIARAKAEIFSGLADGARAVINADDPYGPRLARAARKRGARVTLVGRSERADFRIGDVQTLADGSLFALHHGGDIHPVVVPIAGEHWVANAALAVACAFAAGVPVADAIESLSTLSAMPGRGERTTLKLDLESGEATLTLIDESYNANPESMRAAIAAAAAAPGRKLAVLGTMLELGADELDHHAALSHPLVKHHFDRVVTVGEPMRALRGALPLKMRAAWAEDADSAWEALLRELADGDTVLVKGSNGAGLGALVKRLKTEGFSYRITLPTRPEPVGERRHLRAV